ncbi:MAG TPA: regulatory protein RecX [Thermoleophilia bacterium]|nr:regulatory protein RecX [Thermoleophilia bacterium]
MPTVTALRPTRRAGRLSVHVDGEFLAAVSDAFVARQQLFVGRQMTPDELQALIAAASRDQALSDAYRLLAHRARSRAELRSRLLAKGHTPEVVDGTLERLGGEGLVDDRAFAAAFVADKQRLAGWGNARIARELVRLGVAGDVISGVLPDDHDESGAELERARAALERRGPATAPLDRARKRAFDFLVRRGYSTAVAYQAVREWVDGARSDDVDGHPAGPDRHRHERPDTGAGPSLD